REQFGRPIGSFQAIQHKCANMLVEVESSKSATYYAAWAVANDVPEAPLAAAMAKAYCSDAYRHTAGEGIQIHGGIGFTWEHDMGGARSLKLDYRRLLHGEQEFEYLKPIRPGDVLTARGRTKDVFEKEGKRGGKMLFVITETEFTNQRGEVAAYSRSTLIQTEGAVQG